MRTRGAKIADIAILVIAVDDDVKAQTLEALEAINKAGIPYIVALNKIDTAGANKDKVITSLIEKGVYLEGYGGSIPYVEVSAKTGVGIDTLLELILISAELEELKGDPNIPATGVVIESNLDQKRGISGTLIITNGTIKQKDFIVVEIGRASCRERV